MQSGLIHIEEGFQTSINIAYDLHDGAKISRFIPTNSAIDVIEDILLSTHPTSTQRARILIGAYGRGKSHIVLVLLALLRMKDKTIFHSLMEKIKDTNEELYQYVNDFISSSRKLLPIVVSGSSASLTQSFLGALQTSLEKEGLEGIMPATHFQAAINAIQNWKENYQETYQRFIDMIGLPIQDVLVALENYDVAVYEQFIRIYPALTSGSQFNPFVGFDVVELYEKVNQEIVARGYDGMFVVYDEFSKYLESSIVNATISDIKLLQDFAEKCNRSGKKQLHLLLISHKDISNYIDGNLPKDKVDGWRGVSGRFKHLELQDNFSQIYEVISAVIKKGSGWPAFLSKYTTNFDGLLTRAITDELFDSQDKNDVKTVVEGTFPLHPFSAFILPRISEKIAQNERTLFTFLSAPEKNSLTAFLESSTEDFELLTCDQIYDYFEPLLRKEVYTSEYYLVYKMASRALAKLEHDSIEAKVVKIIALIYIVAQFEKLSPTIDTVVNALRETVSDTKEILQAIDNLIKKECIVYLRRSNGFLKIKENSGVDVPQEINKRIVQIKSSFTLEGILNEIAKGVYLYPTRYNDENEIVRYFDFKFVTATALMQEYNVVVELSKTTADGIVFGVLVDSEKDLAPIQLLIAEKYASSKRTLFVVPKETYSVFEMVYEFAAVQQLKNEAQGDDVLCDEYDVYLDDLSEVVNNFVMSYLMPEAKKSDYFICGKKATVFRKAQLSAQLSSICEQAYPYTPVLNNEAINKNNLPTVAINSRSKIIAGLLAEPLECNLGLSGSGQEVSMMRSILICTGILKNNETNPVISFDTDDANINKVLQVIRDFLITAHSKEGVCFGELYRVLTEAEYGIGLKKGVIPVFLAAVLRELRQSLTVLYGKKEVKLSADLFNAINENPSKYFVHAEDWTAEKEEYVRGLAAIFKDFLSPAQYSLDSTGAVVSAMIKWYLSLPKYAKEMTEQYRGDQGAAFKSVSKAKKKFINALKQVEINPHEFLFQNMFSIFSMSDFNLDILDIISRTKKEYDTAIAELIDALKEDIRYIFGCTNKHSSMVSCLRDWCEKLNPNVYEHLFANNENRILELLKTATNDESQMVQRLAKALTSLRIEDWSSKTVITFVEALKQFKLVVEERNNRVEETGDSNSNAYRLTFVSANGQETSRVIERVEYGRKAVLLRNEIETALEEMGQAISDQEKRQVLIEILESLC